MGSCKLDSDKLSGDSSCFPNIRDGVCLQGQVIYALISGTTTIL